MGGGEVGGGGGSAAESQLSVRILIGYHKINYH